MSEFERQYGQVCGYLQFGDTALVTKRIIDMTLDTGAIGHYRETVALLHWLDTAADQKEIASRLESQLRGLYETLSKKAVHEPRTLISASKIEKSYAGGRFKLGPVDLDIREGEIIGLVGENGNGKTTLLRTLCRELSYTAGTIKYHFPATDGYDLRTQLVYIPQRTDTWYGSMFENLQFTAALYGYDPEENALVVELTTSRLGLRKFRNHSWKSLSSGYKMRFELARMLLRKPRILLIDEPLANLDILAQQTILEDFRAIAKSPFRPVGIVLSSQQLYEVEKTSDQVIFLKNGQQKNLYDTTSEEKVRPLVIEMESEWTQGTLNDALGGAIASLQYNGGTYIVTFNDGIGQPDFLGIVLKKEIPVTYFRDISNSTRRFFTN